MESVKDRLIAFISHIGLSQARFEKMCGLSNGYVNNIRRSVTNDKLQKIAQQFPQLNRDWLLYGEGEMLKSGDPAEPRVSLTSGVPYYNVDFLGGFDVLFNDQTAHPEYLIDCRAFNTATCWCNITGHSMEPEINHGDIIALREVQDTSFLPFGEIYAIVTTGGMRTVKRLGPSPDPEKYSLIPTNKSPEYGVQEIPKNMIARVFEVLGCLKKL